MNREFEAFLELEASLAGDANLVLVGSLRDRLALWTVALKRELDQGLPAAEYQAKQRLYRALLTAARNLGPLREQIEAHATSASRSEPNAATGTVPIVLP